MSNTYKTKFNRDGSVTVWNVFCQQWQRVEAALLVERAHEPFGNVVLPTLPAAERARIERMAEAS